jgi:5-methylcytosine-specific restriction protein A
MARVPMLGLRVAAADTRRVRAPAKVARQIYSSPEFRVWREAVIARAGRRCEANTDGQRCTKAEPRHRMFADHKDEVRDGGALYDVANGQCLCGSHHSAKTAKARAARRGC